MQWLRAACALSLVVPLGVFAGVALFLYEQAMLEAEAKVRRIASIAHEHALKLFETNEILIGRINDLTWGMTPEQIRRNEPDLHARLRTMTRGLTQIHSIWVLDAKGMPLLSSRVVPAPKVDFSVRPGFEEHRTRPGAMTIIPPRVGVVTGEVFFDLSRRRELPDGSFGGVVVVGLYPSYLTNFYRELASEEPSLVVTLVHTDRSILARWPAVADPSARLGPGGALVRALERGDPSGVTTGPSPVDGQRRIGAFRKVGDYPLYVFAGTDRAGTLARWSEQVLVLAAFIFPMSLLLFAACVMALRRTRRQIETSERLQLEAAERQRIEAALRQSQKLEAMGHLTGGVAHDFNNLLMVVNLNAALLRRGPPAPQAAAALEAIERSVAAGTQLTRQLLAFSRKQPLLPRRVDLRELLPALLDLIRPVLGSMIRVSGEVAKGTAAVRVDTSELELAMINLAINARDAMPDGGEVRLHIANAPAAPGAPMQVEIAFSDTGMGISAQDLERVFEPFFTTKPAGKGTGLGLSQVYGLCTRSGGTASVTSLPGAGTTVHLYFPVDAGAPDANEGVQPLRAEPTLGARVLLVEDNDEVAVATRQLLEASDCSVERVPHPAAALALLEADSEFNVVLSDIVMPGAMDGVQFASELRRRHPELPVVLMTGYAARIVEAEAAHLTVLPKPFGAEVLIATLRRAMASSPHAL